MAQNWEYSVDVLITGTAARIVTSYQAAQFVADVARDASFDTNFKNAMAAHRDAILSVKASSTSLPCYLDAVGKWFKMANSGTLTTDNAVVRVPAGNSGVLILHREPTSYVTTYSKAGGAFVAFVDGDTVTVTNGQTLRFSAVGVASQDFVNGGVEDQDTGQGLDSISLFNSTP